MPQHLAPAATSSPASAPASTGFGLEGRRVAMVTYSPYPADPRPRRAVAALLDQGVSVDLICLADEKLPNREKVGELDILRIPITHRRGGKFSYAYQYSAFILISTAILAWRALKRRYDMVHVHNMPDVLVVSGLVPKALGAKVLLDLHDPMPELMTTIFHLDQNSAAVRLIRWLEKWSIARANQVVTVNIACKRIFATRSCRNEKVGVVMNSPDEKIFPLRPARLRASADNKKKLVIVYHGSIVERNGLDLAVEALALVRKTVPEAELRIYGRKTPFLEQVMEQVKAKGLSECVSYLGPKSLEELVRVLDSCDVGVIPNQRNAFTDINTPTRIFEYLSLGKPVIAPRTLGIQDYFGPESLLFFESGNAQELASQLEFVALHPAEALKVAERGQEIFQTHAWPQERGTFLGLVSGLLKDRKRN